MLVVLLTALSVAVLWQDQPPGDCAVRTSTGEARPQLVTRQELLPSGTEGDRRREVVRAVEGLGGPVGSVVTGRFFERLTARPAVLAYGDRLALVSTPSAGVATVEAVDPDTAGTDWAVDLAGDPPWTTFTGGPVGPDLVLAFSGPRPALLTLAGDSVPLSCGALARAGGPPTRVRTDQAGAEVVVASLGPGDARVVRLVDPTSGEVRWTRRGRGPIASVAVTGDLVLLARADSASVATGGLPAPGPGPWVEALSRADGSPVWSFRAAGDRSGPRAYVLLTTGPDGALYLLESGARPRVTALDADGEVRWSRPVRAGLRSAWLWDDRLVLRGPDPAGGPLLLALDTADGRPAWTVRGRAVPPVGDHPRPGLGAPLVEDGTAWVPAPNGLLEVDVATGRASRHDSTARVDQLLRVGGRVEDRVVVLSGTALLVTR